MERVVPSTNREEIQLYMRTYYSLLRSSDAFKIETLVESHIAMQSSLHVGAGSIAPDISALLYSALRLPACMDRIHTILIGQMEKAFTVAGYASIGSWQRVFAPGRRRRMQYDQDGTLAVFIASRSDIDDLVPMLTAYQIEWNKLRHLLNASDVPQWLEQSPDRTMPLDADERAVLAEQLGITIPDLQRLEIVWKDNFWQTIRCICETEKDISLRMVNGSLADYRRATANWWEELCGAVEEAGVDPEQRPLYFVSSNTHVMVNLLTGFATRYEHDLIAHIQDQDMLLAQYESLQREPKRNIENFLYYVLGKYLSRSDALQQLRRDERAAGIYRVPNKHGFEIEAQLIDLRQVQASWLDARVQVPDTLRFPVSDALILNIDYPLGLAAYELLSRITERNDFLRGIYVMGKAATLNARVGDVMIPNVVHDEHSQNTYLFNNCFSARDVRPYMHMGNVLDNQKAITALGTFLQNSQYMSVFYREGYTDIEMESGPYLSAAYEAMRPKRHPENEIVNLYSAPFDIGFLHYASDAPMKHGQTLGAGSMAFMGIESTYATAIAILNRIFHIEAQRQSALEVAYD